MAHTRVSKLGSCPTNSGKRTYAWNARDPRGTILTHRHMTSECPSINEAGIRGGPFSPSILRPGFWGYCLNCAEANLC
eukprot:5474633-Pyramimonas_sp.AAC.1